MGDGRIIEDKKLGRWEKLECGIGNAECGTKREKIRMTKDDGRWMMDEKEGGKVGGNGMRNWECGMRN